MTNAAKTNTSRQFPNSASAPAMVRASMMPMSRPLITVPTTAPRSWSAANEAAIGTTICATAETAPTSATEAYSAPSEGEAAAPRRATALRASSPLTSRRRSSTSPNGTSSASESA
ncbi:hypothetical protein SALBM135S_08520 [Streptomyces alboniger]